jgi:hypothetical protein
VTAPAIDGPIGTVVGMEPDADPMQALLQQYDGDPRLRLFAQLLRARAQAPSAPVTPAPTVEEMERRMERLRRAHGELRGQYLRIAAALGACARCWGDDPRCRDCGGAGTSGFFEPDRELFLCYVLPALRRVHARADARSTPRAQGAHEAETQPEG